MVPNLGATPLAQNGISPQCSVTSSSVSGALSDAPDRGHLGSVGGDVPVDTIDLAADARAVPVAFDVACFGGDAAAAHGTRR